MGMRERTRTVASRTTPISYRHRSPFLPSFLPSYALRKPQHHYRCAGVSEQERNGARRERDRDKKGKGEVAYEAAVARKKGGREGGESEGGKGVGGKKRKHKEDEVVST